MLFFLGENKDVMVMQKENIMDLTTLKVLCRLPRLLLACNSGGVVITIHTSAKKFSSLVDILVETSVWQTCFESVFSFSVECSILI